MLARQVVDEYGDRVQLRVEDLGASPMAEAFGIEKYPAIFVDEALVARPEDFYEWGGPATGKYMPWSDVENRRALQDDLRALIDYRLSGGEVVSLPAIESPDRKLRLPVLSLVDLSGARFELRGGADTLLLVEFWATWCPPCLDTMSWMKTLDAGAVEIVSIAVESDREDVERVVDRLKPAGRIVLATPAIIEAFGGIQAVPTLFLARADGTIERVFYGAPPDLHARIRESIEQIRDGTSTP